MTVSLSPSKVTKLFKYYFAGVCQPDIARKLAVDQSTVSIYSSRFKNRAVEIGLLSAAKEFTVFEEVAALRSLSVELMKVNLVAEDAKEGVKIIRKFTKLGVSPEKHAILVKVCNRINQPGFVEAAIKLVRIEDEAGVNFEDATFRLEKATAELPIAETKLKETKANLKSLSSLMSTRKRELVVSEDRLAQLQREAEARRNRLNIEFEAQVVKLQNEATIKKNQLDREMETKMQQLKIKQEEVEEVARLKASLRQQGLDIPTLIKVSKEFGYDGEKG